MTKTLQKTETQKRLRTRCNVESKSLVDTRAENLPEGRAKRNHETLGDVRADTVMDTLVDALAEDGSQES